MTFSTGYDFSEKDDEEADEEIKRFFVSCFDSVDVCVYLLRALASCLYGYRSFEEFYILTGAGKVRQHIFRLKGLSQDERHVECDAQAETVKDASWS